MPPLLTIAGPTATGKTNLAITLSRLFPSTLFSADSRQVYREMDIVTGKDHPHNFSLIGLDIVKPNGACSVSVWYRHIHSPLNKTWQQNKLPIVVGGTGLYLKALTEGISTLKIPPNPDLRNMLEQLSLPDLQGRLQALDPTRFNKLNHSDRHNPRRLIRAIEISSTPHQEESITPPDSLIIGLKYENNELYEQKVRSRVILRIKAGAVKETKRLLAHYDPTLPAFSSLGYPPLIRYLKHDLTREELINEWTRQELAYAKRQLTWFNKQKYLHWFDPSKAGFNNKVADLVKDWYHETN